MIIEYKLPSRAERRVNREVAVPEQPRRPSQTSLLLALAHRLEERVRSGEAKDYVSLARLSGVSRSRVGQILELLMLAPSIQEHILCSPRANDRITDRTLRIVAKELIWDQQRAVFEQLAASAGRCREPSA
jgi:hypothetical protein